MTRFKLFLAISILTTIGFAQTRPRPADKVADPPMPLSAEAYQRLQQLDQAANVWQVIQEGITALTPDKDAPCDKRIREQVAARRELALSAREGFIWKLRSEMSVPKTYVLADDGKAFVPKEVKP